MRNADQDVGVTGGFGGSLPWYSIEDLEGMILASSSVNGLALREEFVKRII